MTNIADSAPSCSTSASLGNNLRHVVHTCLLLPPSSINWHQSRGGDALHLER